MTRERSHAYPILDLATAYRILRNELAGMGTSELQRDAIAERLGYRTALGGLAARKVGALVQYGLLNRRAASYGLSPLGMRLQRLDFGDAEFSSAILTALEKPVLFKSILGAFRKTGSIPANLADELAVFGIKAGARNDAAEIFLESALFAGIINIDGVFLAEPLLPKEPNKNVLPRDDKAEVDEGWHELELLLPGEMRAYLKLPRPFRLEDYNFLWKSFQALYGLLPEYLGLERPSEGLAKESIESGGRPQLTVVPRKEDRLG